jgi:aryl-phospho-beta-D-glucosidase BglC (GH1 family)
MIAAPTALLALLFTIIPSFGKLHHSAWHIGFVSRTGAQLIGPDGNRVLLRGTNLGGWLVPEGYMWGFTKATSPWQIQEVLKQLLGTEENNQFWRHWYQNFITEKDVHYIRATGMNVIRVPLDYRLFTPEEYPGIWLNLGFQLLDKIIRWSADAGLYVLLDMHAAPCGQTGSNIDNSYGYASLFADRDCRARALEVWYRIARHYANNRTVIGYDLLNEPLPSWVPSYRPLGPALNAFYKEIAKTIRTVDKEHLLFLEGNQCQNNSEICLDTDFDDKIVYSFHSYWAEPTKSVFANHSRFAHQHNLPIFLGESGENTDDWIRAFRLTLEENGIGWAFWTYKRMNSERTMRTFAKPPFWDEVIAYQEHFNDPLWDTKRTLPSRDHVEAALAGLLRNSTFENTRVNEGYVRALGMEP